MIVNITTHPKTNKPTKVIVTLLAKVTYLRLKEEGIEGNKDEHSLWHLTLGNKGMIFIDLNNGAS